MSNRTHQTFIDEYLIVGALIFMTSSIFLSYLFETEPMLGFLYYSKLPSISLLRVSLYY
ncbi:hypothetical protein [Adhaeribacter radiodurans]|uniref:Uncharacterized protein n=1 Tax=Adhaeribacter radiodurans TaxID=2745197 RepID=A0A7L7L8B8_9BACT|nr:hypothetical protein [Adhaeribacter radiodurans]QMU29061.1 hypothetical protein HUW48_13875 [Adhaeribacter radiodurans]